MQSWDITFKERGISTHIEVEAKNILSAIGEFYSKYGYYDIIEIKLITT